MKNLHPPTTKFSFKCKLQDLPILLSFWPGRWHLPDWRNSCAKPRVFRWLFRKNPRKQPNAKMLMKRYASNCIDLCLTTLVVVDFHHLHTCFKCPFLHVSTLHPLLAHHHVCYVIVYCVCTINQLLYILIFMCIFLRPF